MINKIKYVFEFISYVPFAAIGYLLFTCIGRPLHALKDGWSDAYQSFRYG